MQKREKAKEREQQWECKKGERKRSNENEKERECEWERMQKRERVRNNENAKERENEKENSGSQLHINSKKLFFVVLEVNLNINRGWIHSIQRQIFIFSSLWNGRWWQRPTFFVRLRLTTSKNWLRMVKPGTKRPENSVGLRKWLFIGGWLLTESNPDGCNIVVFCLRSAE